VLLLWDRRGRFTRCQMPDARIPRFQQRCPAPASVRQNPGVGVAACKADPAGILRA